MLQVNRAPLFRNVDCLQIPIPENIAAGLTIVVGVFALILLSKTKVQKEMSQEDTLRFWHAVSKDAAQQIVAPHMVGVAKN